MKIGVIGCGNMGGGIAKRLALAGHHLIVCDHDEIKRGRLASEIKGLSCSSVKELVLQSEVVILAVKPKDLDIVSKEFPGNFLSKQLVVSVLAGVRIETLKDRLGDVAILRMMPNLAVIEGNGVVGMTANEEISAETKLQISQLFACLGLVKWYPEKMIDGVTALTGSGPAFVCVMIEAMIEAAVALGFSAEEGQELVLHMMEGTISMLMKSGEHPSSLKLRVSSPGGTTIAGLLAMESAGVRSGISKGFLAAFERSRQLSKPEQ